MQKKFSSDRYDPLSTEKDDVSRRHFIKGVIAAGAVAGTATMVTGCSDSGDSSGGSAAGSVERMISINVNGMSRTVDVAANETLALPIYPELTESQLQYVVDTLNVFLSR